MVILAPLSVGGSLTPVDAAEVVIVLFDTFNCKASAAVEPSATRPTAPVPQILSADSGELPAPIILDGNAMIVL